MRNLSLWLLLASFIIGAAQPVEAAETPTQRIVAAAAPYFQGKAITARQQLQRLVQEPAIRDDPAARLAATEVLIDICIHSHAGDCMLREAVAYADAAKAVPVANDTQKRELARKVSYYLDSARFAAGGPSDYAQILKSVAWAHENPANPTLYIRRQLLLSNVYLALDRYGDAARTVDKILTLIAALKNPQEDAANVALALSDSIGTLVAVGDTERAWGIYKVNRDFIWKSLPARSPDAIAFRLTEAQLLEEVGALKASILSLDAAVDLARQIELDDDVRAYALAQALTLKAVVCVADGQVACAGDALARHPLAARFATPGAAPHSYNEVTYLAARALVGAAGGTPDPIAAAALKAPLNLPVNAGMAALADAYRAAGAALALPPGPARSAGLLDAGRRIAKAAADRPSAGFGVWYRPSAVDQIVISLALADPQARGPDADETAFTLFQLANRRGAAFDADAMTALAQARDALQRRTIHQALRLRARRDRLEREQLQAMAARAAAAPYTGAWPTYDFGARRVLRDFAVGMDAASGELVKAGVSTTVAPIVSLQALQATLSPGEAALSVTGTVGGGVAYMCVRRDTVVRKVAVADLGKAQLDIRVVQAALTAGHAASEEADSQFPVAAAVRLYDVLIRPLEDCLRPGDRILWLPSLSLTAVPLTVLLEHAPPKADKGWDLAAADWMVRRYDVVYPGSAAMIVAARAQVRPAGADFDFLGVGDPILTGATATGLDRGAILKRGMRAGATLADLEALPETRDELEESSRGFKSVKLLTEADATEGGLRGQMIGAYRYLSFATHGLMRDDVQGLSDPALVLTPVSDRPGDDGLLTASEIADLNLSARFVALSACNTANFDLSQAASDLPALASAFAVAGVPSTLATLWSVDSQTSRNVVAATFGALRADPSVGPARALAAAQRSFLAAPPGRPYLHPRFWAPFVILGDGAGEPTAASAQTLVSVETLTTRGGEVVDLARDDGQVLTRFVSDRGADNRHAAGTRASGGGKGWRADTGTVGATRFLAALGRKVVAGGYRPDAAGPSAPAIEMFDRTSGKLVTTWIGPGHGGLNGFVMAGAKTGPETAAFVVADLNFAATKGAAGSHLRVFDLDPSMTPRVLFETDGPDGPPVDNVTLTRSGDALVLTYSQRYPAPPPPAPTTEDDYDWPSCLAAPMTWIEVRDAKTGALRISKTIPRVAVTAGVERNGAVWLGGVSKASCTAEARAIVFATDAKGEARTLYEDATLGASEIRALSPMAGGGVFVAANKRDVFDYRPEPSSPDPGVYGARELPVKISAMLFTLAPDGRASDPKLLSSGSYILLSAAEASDPNDILVGGAVGEQATVFHLRSAKR